MDLPLARSALVIRRPWIDLVLDGSKTWELRSRTTSKRGLIGVIAKGSGTVVGTAVLVDCLTPLCRDEMLATINRHGVPADQIADVMARGWTVPWVLGGARRLATPVPYRHPPGAVTWVNLSDEVRSAVERALAVEGATKGFGAA